VAETNLDISAFVPAYNIRDAVETVADRIIACA
jgi:hypothetical protein